MRSSVIASFFAVVTAGYVPPDPAPQGVGTRDVLDFGDIETDANGRCFGRDVSPAVIETTKVQVQERAEVRDASGRVISPAAFRTETRQQILRERADIRFETLCPPQYTATLVETLQRALKARGFYDGPISGVLDTTTSTAIRRFQRVDGHDSPLLDIRTARKLGLVALSDAKLRRG